MKRVFIICTVALSILGSGCSIQSQKPNVVKAQDTQRVQSVRYGTVLEITQVEIDGDRKFGTVIGGLVGGALGSQAVKGKNSGTQAAATVAGGVAGGVIGNKLGNILTRKKGVQLLIEMSNGDVVSIVQEVDENVTFVPNQEVLIIGDVNLRVLPKTSG